MKHTRTVTENMHSIQSLTPYSLAAIFQYLMTSFYMYRRILEDSTLMRAAQKDMKLLNHKFTKLKAPLLLREDAW